MKSSDSDYLIRTVFGQCAVLPMDALTRLVQQVEKATAADWNFCPRCGKRLGGAQDVHTCSPPAQ